MTPVYIPAVGALVVLAFDLVSRSNPSASEAPRANALSGIRFGSVAVIALVGSVLGLWNHLRRRVGLSRPVSRADPFWNGTIATC